MLSKPTKPASQTEQLRADLMKIVGQTQVLSTAEAMAPHLIDWRGRYQGAACCVVRPASTDQVAAIVKRCAAAQVPMLPQGGNTSHCGAGIPDLSGNTVIINLSRLNKIRAIDAPNNTITLEAGCLLQNVQEAAAAVDRLFPLALAAQGSCQIGGNLATNAGGVQVLRYGNTRELTLGLEVVLPNGEIWNGLRALRKDNTGYDLKQLFIGAEGTLGIITAAVLKLFPKPKERLTAWLAIDSPQAALKLLGQLQSTFDAHLTACELVSDPALQLVLKHIPSTQSPFSGFQADAAAFACRWHLLIELSSGTQDLPEAFVEFLSDALALERLRDAIIAQNATEAARLWALRESISEAQKIEGLSIKHDISVPISRLPEFIERCDAALQKTFPGIRCVTFGHIGDGNLHYNQSRASAAENAELMAMQPQVNRLVHDLVHEMGGSISAEHGIGQLKKDELLRYKSTTEMTLMRTLKTAIDPQGLMNPGKLL